MIKTVVFYDCTKYLEKGILSKQLHKERLTRNEAFTPRDSLICGHFLVGEIMVCSM